MKAKQAKLFLQMTLACALHVTQISPTLENALSSVVIQALSLNQTAK